ncbi:hypothetical protein HYFRA_00009501 [Hymenoscyphus fraxineus]|uniref:Uncharacterized protein n=1 Tax=Hymenoscyphus fraxineus TaxID=746836 RepID=A0A9N9L0V1_9HELO|nr:hypothetical protein HYFRA_00009501 [Hymenoscyphus fraxineus]
MDGSLRNLDRIHLAVLEEEYMPLLRARGDVTAELVLQSTASSIPPPQRREKIYCDKWIHDGDGAFTQMGCKYKHEVPTDKATQMSLGLNHDLPSWYRRAYSVGNTIGSHGPPEGVMDWRCRRYMDGGRRDVEYFSAMTLNYGLSRNADRVESTQLTIDILAAMGEMLFVSSRISLFPASHLRFSAGKPELNTLQTQSLPRHID